MGVDGEEFGAGAERNLRFLKVLVPPVPPSHPPPFLIRVRGGRVSFCLINPR